MTGELTKELRRSRAGSPICLKDVLEFAKGSLALLSALVVLALLVLSTMGWKNVVGLAAQLACEGPDAPAKLLCRIDEQRKAYQFVTPNLELKTMHSSNAPYDWVKAHCRVINLGSDKVWMTYPNIEYYGSSGYPQNFYCMVCDR